MGIKKTLASLVLGCALSLTSNLDGATIQNANFTIPKEAALNQSVTASVDFDVIRSPVNGMYLPISCRNFIDWWEKDKPLDIPFFSYKDFTIEGIAGDSGELSQHFSKSLSFVPFKEPTIFKEAMMEIYSYEQEGFDYFPWVDSEITRINYVPEPSTLALLGVGGLVELLSKRKKE